MSKFKVGDIVEVTDNSTNSYKKGEHVKIISTGLKGIYGCLNSDNLLQSMAEYQIKRLHGEEPDEVKVGDSVLIIKNEGYHVIPVGSVCKVNKIYKTSGQIRVDFLYLGTQIEQYLNKEHYEKVYHFPESTQLKTPKKRPQRRIQEETTNDKNKSLYGI